MSTPRSIDETEMLSLVKRLQHDPRQDKSLWRRCVTFLCGSANESVASEARTLFFADDRQRLGDGDAA